MFLLSKLFLAQFLLLISSSSSILFPLNKFFCFFTAVLSFLLNILYTIDLKVFYFFSTVTAGISASPSFSKACRSSLIQLTLRVLAVNSLTGILFFLILCLTHSSVVDLIITWSILQLTHLLALVFRKSDIMLLHDDEVNEVPVFASWLHLGVLVELSVFEVGVCNDQLVFCADG